MIVIVHVFESDKNTNLVFIFRVNVSLPLKLYERHSSEFWVPLLAKNFPKK